MVGREPVCIFQLFRDALQDVQSLFQLLWRVLHKVDDIGEKTGPVLQTHHTAQQGHTRRQLIDQRVELDSGLMELVEDKLPQLLLGLGGELGNFLPNFLIEKLGSYKLELTVSSGGDH